MIDSIIGRVKKVIFKFCDKQAKSRNVAISNVQLLLGLDQEGNTYTLCIQNKPIENYDIYSVLQIPKNLDFTGLSVLAPKFIAKSIIRFAGEKELNVFETRILCIPYLNERGRSEVALLLYNGIHEVGQIQWDDLFKLEEMIEQNM